MKIYTDGACLGNPGPGGWGFVAIHGGVVAHQASGHDAETTNNRMELMGAIEACAYALTAHPQHPHIEIITDSQYVKNGITEWIHNWKKKGWRGSNGPVKNVDLWKALDDLNQKQKLHWSWVKGHNGDHGNELADQLATNAAKQSPSIT